MKRIILTLTLALFTLPILNAQDLPSYVPTEGLVAYYPFNGNANDASGNGHHATVNGARVSTDRFGNSDKSSLSTTYSAALPNRILCGEGKIELESIDNQKTQRY